MAEALFYALAIGALISAANVVFRRNPVVSTVNLVMVFFCLSGIYLLIGFPLVAAIQLLVYTGAILVLFLFVILLLNLRREEEATPQSRVVLGITCALALAILAIAIAAHHQPQQQINSVEVAQDSASAIGKELFSTYLVPFEATGILLLGAIVGVILLSRKDKKGASS